MSMPMWEHELHAEVAYRMERAREAARPRQPGRLRLAWRARRSARRAVDVAPAVPGPLDLGPTPLGPTPLGA